MLQVIEFLTTDPGRAVAVGRIVALGERMRALLVHRLRPPRGGVLVNAASLRDSGSERIVGLRSKLDETPACLVGKSGFESRQPRQVPPWVARSSRR